MRDEDIVQDAHDGVVDSLLDSLVLICRIHGVATSKDALVSGLPLRDGKMTPTLLKRSADRVNLAVTILKTPLNSIRQEFLPAILLLKGEEACVVTKLDFTNNQVGVIFPELGEAEVLMPLDELLSRSSGYVIVAKPKFVFDQRAPSVGKVRLHHWFWGSLAENSRIYRDVMIAAFVVNMLALAMPLFTMNVYDRVLPNRATETLWVMAIGIALIVVGDLILRTMRSYFLDWASTRIDIKLTARIMEQVLGIRLEQRPNSVGSFASNLRSFETVRDFITSATIKTIVDITFGLIFVIVIGWIAWPLVIPVLLGAVLILIYSFSV
ncbi:MAG: ABC transporter transmembrane domain-containing protein, partial [Methylotenera sp.]|nr:ABC transporter transmembrane domain-containing protein [Methylotenera sp.]